MNERDFCCWQWSGFDWKLSISVFTTHNEKINLIFFECCKVFLSHSLDLISVITCNRIHPSSLQFSHSDEVIAERNVMKCHGEFIKELLCDLTIVKFVFNNLHSIHFRFIQPCFLQSSLSYDVFIVASKYIYDYEEVEEKKMRRVHERHFH